jgi:prepilin-type N-terminal cleavage/methylation domain-containing protein
MLKLKRGVDSGGFTLIELLIVIVIIGILAGVLIAVIDPGAQQNRARDANVISTMNKVVLATQGFVSAYGRVPDGEEFLANLSATAATAATPGTDCVATGTNCLFEVTGNALPVDSGGTAACDASGYTGADEDQCYFYYTTTSLTGTDFVLYGKSFGLADTVFAYDTTLGELYDCSTDSPPVCNTAHN